MSEQRVKLFPPTRKDWHPLPHRPKHFLQNLGHGKFLAIRRRSRQNDSVRIDEGRASAKRQAIVGPNSIRDDDVTLILSSQTLVCEGI